MTSANGDTTSGTARTGTAPTGTARTGAVGAGTAGPIGPGRPRRVLIAEDEQLMRHALTIFLRGAEDLEVVGTAENGALAVEAVARLSPDVVLMDIHMPVMDGIEATRRILHDAPHTTVVALTTLGSVEAAVPMLRAGARGYLLKDCDPATLISSIRQAAGGEPALAPSVTMALLQAVADGDERLAGDLPRSPSAHAPALTTGDKDVLELLAAGANTAEMATALVVAEATVKSRLAKLCAKFGVDGRVRLLIRATELGLVSPRLHRH
ncbi:response regulator transcription factor [Mobilicoccus sp.]|uniref:response regulator transcription factor n=1 Tax=Mobilicoccus sp. TaxID=2034349 RepID=UPI0028A8DE84|nr:response regulator transcription factor [Mobilicoccus sp.]